jgi:acyl carrier protein
MSDDLAQRVMSVIATTQHIEPEKISIDSTFQELKIDSLDGINILFALENEFNISIPDAAAQQIRTVREMVEGVRTLLEGGPGQAPVAAQA